MADWTASAKGYVWRLTNTSGTYRLPQPKLKQETNPVTRVPLPQNLVYPLLMRLLQDPITLHSREGMLTPTTLRSETRKLAPILNCKISPGEQECV